MSSKFLRSALLDVKWSNCTEKASFQRRFFAFVLFCSFMSFCGDWSSRFVGWAFSFLEFESMAAKQLRTCIRMLMLEPSDEVMGVWWLLSAELTFNDLLLTYVLPQATFGLLMLGASLACEQLSKSICGIVVLQKRLPATATAPPPPQLEPRDPNDAIDEDNDNDDDDDNNDNNNDSSTSTEVIIPAWVRLLTLWRYAPLMWLEYLRLLFGYERLADVSANRTLVCCRASLPFALRSLFDERVRIANRKDSRWLASTNFLICLALMISFNAPHATDMTQMSNPFAAIVTLRDRTLFGASKVHGERVRIAPLFVQARSMMGMNATQHAQRGAVLHASSKHRRAYLDANGARIELDVGDNLFQRTGLWYGAEFSTPFGSAMLVGIDDASVLWFAHDASMYLWEDVRLISLGHAVRYEHLAKLNYRLMEDELLVPEMATSMANAPIDTSLTSSFVNTALQNNPGMVHIFGGPDGGKLVPISELPPAQQKLVQQVMQHLPKGQGTKQTAQQQQQQQQQVLTPDQITVEQLTAMQQRAAHALEQQQLLIQQQKQQQQQQTNQVQPTQEEEFLENEDDEPTPPATKTTTTTTPKIIGLNGIIDANAMVGMNEQEALEAIQQALNNIELNGADMNGVVEQIEVALAEAGLNVQLLLGDEESLTNPDDIDDDQTPEQHVPRRGGRRSYAPSEAAEDQDIDGEVELFDDEEMDEYDDDEQFNERED